jgi:GTP 3',8-cyclase
MSEKAVRVTLRGPVSGSVDATSPPPEEMPLDGPLVDGFGRVHTDLRISVTDRCNLRCVYCMPEEGVPFMARSELLTFEEITRFARVCKGMGVTSVRLTGGEPLVRKGVVDLVRLVASVGFDDLAMTTNGISLAPLSGPLADVGLKRVNISCDSLRRERFEAMRRRGDLGTVLGAMVAAEQAGLQPLKVNVVLVKGWNEDEVVDFAVFARETGRIVRFIEYMPLDAEGAWTGASVVPGDRVLSEISSVWPLEEVGAECRVCSDGDGATLDAHGTAPAERFRFVDGAGEIGIIRSVTQPFCGTCDRLRLTADGAVRNCLFSDAELSVRDLMRAGGTDEEIALLIRRSVWAKAPGHGINEPGFLRPRRSMSMIGG